MFNEKECCDDANLSLKEKAIKRLDKEMIFIDEKKIEEFKKKLENVLRVPNFFMKIMKNG